MSYAIKDLRRIMATKLLMMAFKSTPSDDLRVRLAFGPVFYAMTEVQ